MRDIGSTIWNWFVQDLHRLWWLVILALPLIIFFVDRNLLLSVLALLIAFPLVEFVFGVVNIFSGGRSQKTIISGHLYTSRLNAFPAFVTEIIVIAYLSTYLEQGINDYLSGGLGDILGVYLILLGLFIYYYLFGSKNN